MQALVDQFSSIRKTLSANVETIGELIKQAGALSEIAQKLDGATATDKDTKE